MKTYIINETTQAFHLKEGNAGAFRMLTELKEKGHKNSKFTIKVDPNATYREYMVATGKKGKTIIITSDDFSEYEVIKIIKVDPPEGAPPGTPVAYRSVPSNPRKPQVQLTTECEDGPSNAGDGLSSTEVSSNAGSGQSAPGVSSAESDSALGVSFAKGDSTPVVAYVKVESAPGVSISASAVPSGPGATSAPAVSSAPGVSSNAVLPEAVVSGSSSNAGIGEPATEGSLGGGPAEPPSEGANHVAWYKKFFKSSR